MDKVCKICGKIFVYQKGTTGRKCCSRECKDKLKHAHDCHMAYDLSDGLYHGTCKHCGSSFVSSRKRMYCTQECAEQHNRERASAARMEPKGLCKTCGKPITKGRSIYCSDKCNPKNNRGKQLILTDDIIRDRIEARYDTIEYISGHTCGGMILVRCKICGREFSIGERASRKTYNVSCAYHREPTPKKEREAIACEICGKTVEGRPDAKVCSRECAMERARRRSALIDKAKHDKATKPRKCKQCGTTFIPEYGSKQRTFCSEQCCKRYSSKTAKITRRARKKKAFVSKVDYREIFERDHGKCQLCGKPVNDRHKAPAPDSGTLDHIIPLALGGTHEPKNVQLAHFICNARKGIKAMNEQLRLI